MYKTKQERIFSEACIVRIQFTLQPMQKNPLFPVNE